jgi:hypothetical protein
MPQAQSFYERQSALAMWFVLARIGQDLGALYKVPTELPPKLLTLVRRLDESDLLFPSTRQDDDVDLFAG